MAVCPRCRAGRHSHDTFGPMAIEVQRGERRVGDDAGCSRLVEGHDCTCGHVGPNNGTRQHRACPTCTC